MGDGHKNRGGHNKINLEGKRFGKLLVVKDTGKRKTRRPIWLCKCDCGKECNVLGKYLLIGDTKSCGCYSKGNAHNRTGYRQVSGSVYYHIKSNAKRRGIPFEITPEQIDELFEKQNGLCAISGVPIVLVPNYRDQSKDNTASLDRIDNFKGYTYDNVQWVHKIINVMRNKLTIKEFTTWCKQVTQNQIG